MKKQKNINYICSECAKKNGGKWQEGYAATWHMAKCDICKKEKELSCASDWIFPKSCEFAKNTKSCDWD